MQQIKHVFFDLDHTLWDFEANSKLAFQAIFKKHSIQVDLNDFLEVYIPINLAYWKLYRDEKVSKETLRYERLKKVFDALNYEIDDVLIDKLSIDYIDELPNNNLLFENTVEVLEKLSKKYKLHIITNGFEEVQAKKMKNANIYHFFNVIVTAESVGVKKPNPKIFNFALQQANAKKENSIMIGDSFEADVEGAQNVGIKAIHFVDSGVSEANINHIQINNLSQLHQYL